MDCTSCTVKKTARETSHSNPVRRVQLLSDRGGSQSHVRARQL
jgi:hypothetical protein